MAGYVADCGLYLWVRIRIEIIGTAGITVYACACSL